MSRPDPRAVPSICHARRVLFEGLGASVAHFHCRAPVHPDGPEEESASHSIVLVRRGVFRRTASGETLVADANRVVFFNADDVCRFAHPVAGGDDCTVVALTTERALELVARHAPREAERPERPFPRSHGASPRRVARLHYELLALARKDAPALAIEDAVSELADAAVRAGYAPGWSDAPLASVSAAARRRQREMVDAVKVAVNDRLDAAPSLGELARLAGCSPFHLSRVFSRTEGTSLRRYALRLRARVAADRLAACRSDLTTLALDLGYADHSHFTNAFRDEWGVPPSRFGID
jgi:AraC family transcriptional regulator